MRPKANRKDPSFSSYRPPGQQQQGQVSGVLKQLSEDSDIANGGSADLGPSPKEVPLRKRDEIAEL